MQVNLQVNFKLGTEGKDEGALHNSESAVKRLTGKGEEDKTIIYNFFSQEPSQLYVHVVAHLFWRAEIF